MYKPKFYGKKKNGKFVFNEFEREEMEKHLAVFNEDQDLEMTVDKKYKRRTSGQPDEETNFNGYFWVIIGMISDEMGELDKDYTHDLVLNQVGHFRVDKYGDKHALETKDLSGGEFAELCSKIRIWASKELSLYLPEPHECEGPYRI